MNNLFNLGPDGLILVEALVMSVVVALLAWRRVGLRPAAAVTAAVALAWVVFHVLYKAPGEAPAPTLTHQIVIASFTIVPSAFLLGASRIQWLSRHAWALLLAGPIAYIGCFAGLCDVCFHAGMLS